MNDCIFCKIVAGEIPAQKAYEDDEIVAFHDVSPQAPLHLVVIPKRHIENIAALTDEDKALAGGMILKIAGIARSLGIDGYRVVSNVGKEGGQSVFHLHFHILGGKKLGGRFA
jgi:histidine triad (HIT) family protein